MTANRLHALRERLGFSVDEVALVADLSREDVRELERLEDASEIDADLARRLEDIYGVDIDRWLDLPETELETALPPVATLLRAQAEALGSVSRFAIAESMTVARRARVLEQLLGDERWPATRKQFDHDKDYSDASVGERLAQQARTKFQLPPGPIPSMRALLEQVGVLVLWEELPRHLDALALAADDIGGVVLANARGDHMNNAFRRRVSFAHELCHLLYDRPRMQQVERFCVTDRGGKSSSTEAIERRARAFTMYFLAPRDAVIATWNEAPTATREARIRRIMERFGVGYEATRHHLHFLQLLDYAADADGVAAEPPLDWERADPGPAEWLERKALDNDVSKLRAGALFGAVWRAYRNGVLTDSAARDELRIDAGAWQRIKLGFAGQRSGEWSTSSAIHE